MANKIRTPSILFSFKEISELHHQLIQSFISLNFNVILACSKLSLESNIALFQNADESNYAKIYECDFEDELSVKQFQNVLFENHYPLDIVFTDFSQEKIISKSSFEVLKNSIEAGLQDYFHLLKCAVPLMNSNKSFFYHFLKTEDYYKENEGIQIFSKIAAAYIFEIIKNDNSVSNIEFNELNGSLFYEKEFLEQMSLHASNSLGRLHDFLKKNATVEYGK